MKKKGIVQVVSVLSAFALTVSMFSFKPYTAFAENVQAPATQEDAIVQQNSYEQYIGTYESTGFTGQTVKIDLSSYSTAENIEIKNEYKGKSGKIVLTNENSRIEWSVDIPKTGLYSINLDYYPMEGTVSTIKRSVFIDGRQPFDEVSCVEFLKVFKNEGEVVHKVNENDLRPMQVEAPQWLNTYIKDMFGYFGSKLEFYLTEGKHTICLNSLAEPMAIGAVTLESKEDNIPDYQTVLKQQQNNGAKIVSGVLKNGIKTVQAENTYEKSEPTLYPISDNSSPANQPYSYNKQKINSIGGTRWQNPGQWISWQMNVPESGFYEIGFRSKQNFIRDIDSVRSISIDGKIPFKEAQYLQFSFNNRWTVSLAGKDAPYLFYLEKGTRTIKMEVTLGKLANSLMQASESLKQLNQANWDLLTLLGVRPDLNRDYNIKLYMPEVIKTFQAQKAVIETIIRDWTAMTGKQDANIALMNQLVFQLKKMTENPDSIPGLYLNFKDSVSSFANMLLNAKQQPLTLDFLFIAEKGAVLPRADVNFFSSMKNGFLKFFISFFSNYNDLSKDSESGAKKPITVWIGNGISGGRDQAIVLSQLIQQDFTSKNGIPVNLQLIPPATILTATIAGKGPDAALQINGGDPANYAMRGAVEDLSKLPGWDSVRTRFSESAITPYVYNGGVYALPETFSFPMLFYRKDILNQLGIDIQQIKTWQNLIEALPVIQRKNMNVALSATFNTYTMFLYQMNGSLYRDNGKATNLDDKVSLDAFYNYMRFYTDYNLPFTYNFVTRFRTGELPIGIEDYTTYNLLQISAPEISGEWGMMPVPGFQNKDGTINNTVPSTGAGCILMSDSKQKTNAWEFMKWLTTSDIQYKFGKELESVMGVGARYNSANIEALQRLPWQVQDKKVLNDQMKTSKGIPEVPGGYLTQRNVGFAMNTVYNTNTNARDTLLNYIDQINQEIAIKRAEFNLK